MSVVSVSVNSLNPNGNFGHTKDKMVGRRILYVGRVVGLYDRQGRLESFSRLGDGSKVSTLLLPVVPPSLSGFK